MSCADVRRSLAGYLDGALGAGAHSRARAHLDSCAACRAELEHFRKLSVLLGRVEPTAPPPQLVGAIRERVAAARARSQQWQLFTWRVRAWFEDIFEPVAVPATGGVLTAVLVFAIVVQSLVVGVPLGAVPNDLPLTLNQPARLESLAPFAIAGITVGEESAHSGVLIVEATLDATGSVVDYRILSGPDDSTVRRQLDQVMLFSHFRPQMSFGRPTAGGRVVLSFSEVRVRG